MIVIWDVDDVLNDFTHSWLKKMGLPMPPGAGGFLDPGHWFCANGWAHEAYLDAIDQFREESYVDLAPNVCVVRWFESDTNATTHIALTRTPLRFAPIVSSWVMEHFGKWLRGVLVTPSRRADDPVGTRYPTKASVLAAFEGSSVLVDDSPANLTDLPDRTVGILFPQPWNSSVAAQNQEVALQYLRSHVLKAADLQ